MLGYVQLVNIKFGGGVRMIIELPKNFYKTCGDRGFAQVRDGTLEIHGDFSFNYEKLMIELTYEMKGRTKCYYCGKEIAPEKVTIDHLFPRDFGGITIPNNLEPACEECNEKKSNLNYAEFQIWKGLEEASSQKIFYKETIKRKRKKKCDTNNLYGFDLPKGWVTYVPLEVIKKVTSIDTRGSKQYNKMINFYDLYKKLPRVAIISANNILLIGETVYAVAKKRELDKVPAIILENVMWFKK